jgi:hypothetical protein
VQCLPSFTVKSDQLAARRLAPAIARRHVSRPARGQRSLGHRRLELAGEVGLLP